MKSKSKERSRIYEARVDAAIKSALKAVAGSRKEVAKAKGLCDAARETVEKSKAKRSA